MLLSKPNDGIVHLFTDIHLNVISFSEGAGQIIYRPDVLTGNTLPQLFDGATTEMLNDVVNKCLQHPGTSHNLGARVGLTGSDQKFQWLVCAAVKSGTTSTTLIWTGTTNTLKCKQARRRTVTRSTTNIPISKFEIEELGNGLERKYIQNLVTQDFTAESSVCLESEEIAYIKKRFELAALISNDVIIDWDIENDSIWRSKPPAPGQLLTFDGESMQGPFLKAHRDDQRRLNGSLDEAIHSGAIDWKAEYRSEAGSVNGRFNTVIENARIIRNAEGKATRMISVVHDVTEQRKLRQELRRKEKELIAATIEGQEAERKELSRELHDNVGQVLAMCKLFVEIAAEAVHHEYMDKCHDQLERALQEIRSLSHRLSPELLDRKGLPGAIATLTDNVNGTARLDIELIIEPRLYMTELDKAVQKTAYRIVQELISNTLKHAQASKALLQLWADESSLHIEFKDDGTGFDPKKVAGGIGLRNMHNRVEVVGGTLEIESKPGEGSCTRITLPV